MAEAVHFRQTSRKLMCTTRSGKAQGALQLKRYTQRVARVGSECMSESRSTHGMMQKGNDYRGDLSNKLAGE